MHISAAKIINSFTINSITVTCEKVKPVKANVLKLVNA